MENELKSPKAGKVIEVIAVEGTAVESERQAARRGVGHGGRAPTLAGPGSRAKARSKSSRAEGRLPDHERHRARAGGRASQPRRGLPPASWASPASTRSPAASSPPCTAAGSGPCASTPASAPPRRPTRATATCSTQGQTGLSVAFDLPDPDGLRLRRTRARGRGRQGRASPSTRSTTWRCCSTGIPLDEVSTSMTINATAPILLCAVHRGRPRSRACRATSSRGTVQNDILKEYIARGTYIYPPRAVDAPRHRHLRVLREARCRSWNTDLDQRLPHPRGGLDRGAGDGVHARPTASRTSRPRVDARARRRRVRAAAVVLLQRPQRLARGDRQVPRGAPACGRGSCASASARRTRARMMLRFHTQTAGSTLTAQQPDNNVVRVALQALAAVLGGAPVAAHQLRATRRWRCPPRQSVRTRAAHPAGHRLRVPACADVGGSARPAATRWSGSPTRSRRGADATSARIDALGGMVEAIAEGFQQQEIQDAAYACQRAHREGGDGGGRRQQVSSRRGLPEGLCASNETVERKQAAQLAALQGARRRPGQRRWTRWGPQQRGADNLIPLILDAVKRWRHWARSRTRCRDVFGEHRETVVL